MKAKIRIVENRERMVRWRGSSVKGQNRVNRLSATQRSRPLYLCDPRRRLMNDASRAESWTDRIRVD